MVKQQITSITIKVKVSCPRCGNGYIYQTYTKTIAPGTIIFDDVEAVIEYSYTSEPI